MENASKALIIAGAILLAILIIGIGIYVFNNANSSVEEIGGSMSTVEIQSFNSQFESYQGKNKSGTQVKTLLQNVVAVNSQHDDSRKITINIRNMASSNIENSHSQAQISPAITEISSTERFTVEIFYGSMGNRNGLVQHIKITKE